jgi:hypothetical protein
VVGERKYRSAWGSRKINKNCEKLVIFRVSTNRTVGTACQKRGILGESGSVFLAVG